MDDLKSLSRNEMSRWNKTPQYAVLCFVQMPTVYAIHAHERLGISRVGFPTECHINARTQSRSDMHVSLTGHLLHTSKSSHSLFMNSANVRRLSKFTSAIYIMLLTENINPTNSMATVSL
jgi:hypothetical protein